MGLLDYPKIVKKPMDFDTCKAKLQSGEYPTYEDYFSDLQLIWDNCKLFNRADSEIYKLAEKMEKLTRREMQKFRSNYGLHALILPSERRNNKRATDKKTSSAAPADNLGGGTASQGGDQVLGEMVETSKVDVVTREMKVEFVTKIKKLSIQGLTSLVNKVKEVKPLSIADMPEERIKISVDEFNKQEFLLVSDHVDEILLQELPSKRQKTE
uniref:Bromo domain-containing protein n=1 Tax=Strombidium rassoulzadegani TaxID=1082188 RepID=A0A7S3FUQ5_9SPIT|mmetsp:Transcript_16619/g.28319  ORF Transcript_16619/g.28319 Transcript_16619/m.28319 type:complete len:212 (+) Transcript_16619:142-777(+)